RPWLGGAHCRAPAVARAGAGRAAASCARLFHPRGDRRKHHVQHPQGHQLVGAGERAHHQYELRRTEGPFARARAQSGVRQRHRFDRRRRQCRAEISSAFPAAIPFVIAVTATDVDDKLFTGANRGKYISVAAPGVDILVPAPEGGYQMTTGTSVAAAEVSGIVALLLERNPKLTPADIRRILTASAKRLAPGERDNNFGSGLI